MIIALFRDTVCFPERPAVFFGIDKSCFLFISCVLVFTFLSSNPHPDLGSGFLLALEIIRNL